MLSLPPAASTKSRRGDPPPAPPLDMRERPRRSARPSAVLEARHRRPERDQQLRGGGELGPVQLLDPRPVAPALEALEAEGRVGRDPGQRLGEHRVAGGEQGAGRPEPGLELGGPDRPGRQAPGRPASQGRAREVDRVERQAAPAPEVRGAAEPPGDGDLRRMVGRGIEVLGLRQRLRRGAAPPGRRSRAASTRRPRRASASAVTSPTGPPPITQTCAPKAASAAKSGASEIIAPPFRPPARARHASPVALWHGGGRASAPGQDRAVRRDFNSGLRWISA